MNNKLRGIIIPSVTPFDEDGNLNISGMEINFSKWLETDIAGFMVLGTNGEFVSLADDEAYAVTKEAVNLKQDRTLIVGVGRESLVNTINFIDRISNFADDIDFISVVTPHYFAGSMTGSALYDYYIRIADFSPIPVLLYVAPTYNNNVIVPPNTLTELAKHPNIVGVKDTSKDQLVNYMIAARDKENFDILAGSLGTLMTDLLFGGPGGVVSAANYFPQECADLTNLFFSGKTSESIENYIKLQKLIKVTGGKSGIASLKATMNLLGYEAGYTRLPVQPLPKEEVEKIKQELINSGKL